MRDTPGHRRTCKRYDVLGHAHFLTFTCWNRQKLLNSDRTRLWFIDAMEAARAKAPFDLWSFVIMPEHAHVLVLPHEGTEISDVLFLLKAPVARRAVAWVRKEAPEFLRRMVDRQPSGRVSYRFWLPGGGYDRNLWTAQELHEKIHYIHNNTVRAGLVERAEDWPWSSCRAWESETDEPLRIDRESLPPLELT